MPKQLIGHCHGDNKKYLAAWRAWFSMSHKPPRYYVILGKTSPFVDDLPLMHSTIRLHSTHIPLREMQERPQRRWLLGPVRQDVHQTHNRLVRTTERHGGTRFRWRLVLHCSLELRSRVQVVQAVDGGPRRASAALGTPLDFGDNCGV